MNIKNIKNQFSIFTNHPDVVYLDNAASTQTPDAVLDAMNIYYTNYRANIHRGLYSFSDLATQTYEKARDSIAKFIGADSQEIVFTGGVTHGLNMLAAGLGKYLKPGDNVVLTEMEHHANIIPWQEASKIYGFELRFIPVVDFKLDMDVADQLIDERTKIVSFTAISNAIGTINPVHEIITLAKKIDAITVVDYAQAITSYNLDVRKLNCDFLVFSGHKMCGPTGIGVLYGKKERLEALDPFMYGGGMIREVSLAGASWADAPAKFEGGTPNISGAIGLGAAIDFLTGLGMEQIKEHRAGLAAYLVQELSKVVNIIGNVDEAKRSGVVSFAVGDVHAHDVADILNSNNVAIRAGHHCAMPLMKKLGISGTARASIGIYNSKEDVNRLVQGIGKVKEIFKI